MLKCPCPEAFVSTYRHHYRPTTSAYFRKRGMPTAQTDEALVSGHFRTNLLVKGHQFKSKVWPETALNAEEYKDFLKRFECCKKDLYRLYFACPQVDIDLIDERISDLEKTVYQHDYSPNDFSSRKETLRYAKNADAAAKMKYYRTTYRTYYNRLQEMERFMNIYGSPLPKPNPDILHNELKKIYKLGVTTYHSDICIPAREILKLKLTPTGPIDRYTLRRP